MRRLSILGVMIALAGIERQTATAAAVPVLVELFTAEAARVVHRRTCCSRRCWRSSRQLARRSWGWGNTWTIGTAQGGRIAFRRGFTRRQEQYATRAGGNDVYTPQMVVDGGEGFVGADIAAARRAIEHAVASPHGEITIELDPQADGSDLCGRRDPQPSGYRRRSADVLVAATEDGLHTDVKGGENRGRALAHAVVVRDLVTVGPATGQNVSTRTTIQLRKDWRRDALKIVAFVQQRRSRHILATAVRPVVSGR